MPQNIQRKLTGFCVLVLMPIVIFLGLVFFWIQSPLFAFPIFLIVAGMYAFALFVPSTYGPEKIREVSIPSTSAPEDILKMLKITSQGGDLIYIHLITAVKEEANPNQSDLSRHVKNRHKVMITPQAIREQYIVPLEGMGIIRSIAVSKQREYKLTPQGEWCLTAIKTCFPPSNFYYYVRHYLGRLKLPEYPKIDDDKTSSEI